VGGEQHYLVKNMTALNILISAIIADLEALIHHGHLDFGEIPFAEPALCSFEEEAMLVAMEAHAFDLWLCQNDW